MTTNEIAQKLVEQCRNHTEAQALSELYADNAQSIEPMAPEGMDPVTNGIEGIRGKHDWWANTMEVHGGDLEGPFVNGDRFCVIFEIDATDKTTDTRWKMREVGLYEVADGKIVRETFFMTPMG